MLQKEFKTLIAEILQNANPEITMKIGTSADEPADTDGGLKGSELVSVITESDQSGSSFIAKTAAPIVIPAGEAREMVFINQDGVVMDRLLITPLTGGPNTKVELEYRLEVI